MTATFFVPEGLPKLFRHEMILSSARRAANEGNDMNYRKGSIIEYVNMGGERLLVKVDGREDGIKNGRPGFDGTVVAFNGKQYRAVKQYGEVRLAWGYDAQITRVVKL